MSGTDKDSDEWIRNSDGAVDRNLLPTNGFNGCQQWFYFYISPVIIMEFINADFISIVSLYFNEINSFRLLCDILCLRNFVLYPTELIKSSLCAEV